MYLLCILNIVMKKMKYYNAVLSLQTFLLVRAASLVILASLNKFNIRVYLVCKVIITS